MAATLDDVKKELIDSRKVTDDILKTNKELVSEMTKYFSDLKERARQAALNEKEKSRETKNQTKTVTAGGGKGGTGGGLNIFGIPALGGIQKALATITGGILAIEAALLGFRGWELGALKGIKNIGENLKGKTAVFGTAIFTKINDAFAGTRARILRLFGLGVDGKPIVVQGKDGKFEVPTFRKITNAIKGAFTGVTTFITDAADAAKNKLAKIPGVTKITNTISSLFAGVVGFVDGVVDYFKTAASAGGNKVIAFLTKLGVAGLTVVGAKVTGFGGAVAKIFGKFLWPLGILVSGYDAVMAFINTEGTLLEKTMAGVSGFVASFIGAPLDLLKNLLIKAITLFGIEVDSEGKIVNNDGSLPLTILQKIQEFSFQDYLLAVPRRIKATFDFIMSLFRDPIGVGKEILGDTIEGIKSLFFAAMRSIIGSIPGGKAIADKFFTTSEEKVASIDSKIANIAAAQKIAMDTILGFESKSNTQLIAEAKAMGGDFSENKKLLTKQYNESKKEFMIQNYRIDNLTRQLNDLRIDRAMLLAEESMNRQGGIVSAPTNNISNVNQGFTLPSPANHDDAMVPGFR